MGFFSKDIKTLDDLFVHTLRDIYYAEKQIEKANSDFEAITGKDLNALNSKLTSKKLEPLKLLTKEEWDKRQS